MPCGIAESLRVAVEVAEAVEAPGQVGQARDVVGVVLGDAAVERELLVERGARAREIGVFAQRVAEIVERARHVAPGGQAVGLAREQLAADLQPLVVQFDGGRELLQPAPDIADFAEQLRQRSLGSDGWIVGSEPALDDKRFLIGHQRVAGAADLAVEIADAAQAEDEVFLPVAAVRIDLVESTVEPERVIEIAPAAIGIAHVAHELPNPVVCHRQVGQALGFAGRQGGQAAANLEPLVECLEC